MALISIISSRVHIVTSLLILSTFAYLNLISSVSSNSLSDNTVAIVGNDIIRNSEIDIFIKNLTVEAKSLPEGKLRNIVLKQLINNKFIALMAKSQGLDKSEDFLALKNISDERILHHLYL